MQNIMRIPTIMFRILQRNRRVYVSWQSTQTAPSSSILLPFNIWMEHILLLHTVQKQLPIALQLG